MWLMMMLFLIFDFGDLTSNKIRDWLNKSFEKKNNILIGLWLGTWFTNQFLD